LLNLLAYVLFVVVSYGVVVSHACLLKCTPLEAVLEIFTKALLPLWIFRSRSIRGILGRVVLCWVIGAVLFEAYGRWLHSDSFPRPWLDARAQEWVHKQEELSQRLRDNASAFPPPK
jgi:hypothetical protein